MKSNLYLDPTTYDLILDGNFNLRITQTYTEWLSQKIENVLKTFKGEWFANFTIGVPFYESILKKNPNVTEVNAIFQNKIKGIDGVAELTKFDVSYDNSERTYSIDIEVLSNENEIVDVGTITI